jgi:Flp pilus assembly pilin Flp
MLNYLRSERGSAAGEYALLLSVLCCAVALAALFMSDSVGGSLQRSGELFAMAHASAPPAACNGNGQGNHGNGQGNCGGDGANEHSTKMH